MAGNTAAEQFAFAENIKALTAAAVQNGQPMALSEILPVPGSSDVWGIGYGQDEVIDMLVDPRYASKGLVSGVFACKIVSLCPDQPRDEEDTVNKQLNEDGTAKNTWGVNILSAKLTIDEPETNYSAGGEAVVEATYKFGRGPNILDDYYNGLKAGNASGMFHNIWLPEPSRESRVSQLYSTTPLTSLDRATQGLLRIETQPAERPQLDMHAVYEVTVPRTKIEDLGIDAMRRTYRDRQDAFTGVMRAIKQRYQHPHLAILSPNQIGAAGNKELDLFVHWLQGNQSKNRGVAPSS